MMGGESFVIGVDIGGTNIVVGAMPTDGSREIGVRTAPTGQAEGPARVMDRITQMIDAVIDDLRSDDSVTDERISQDHRRGGSDTEASSGASKKPPGILGIGVGAPGPLSRRLGEIIETPHLDWKGFNIVRELSDRTNLRVTLDNDANCAVLAEWWKGAAHGASNVIGLTLGTGIGGGIMIDGRLYRGLSDGAGELGHITVRAEGRRCACGKLGCLEAYASASSVVERWHEAGGRLPESSIYGISTGRTSEISAGNSPGISARDVFALAAENDEMAVAIVDETAEMLAVGLGSLINIFNPEVVVIGGGMSLAADQLIPPLRERIKRHTFSSLLEVCRISPASLPLSAGMVGAIGSFRLQTSGSI